MTADASNLLHRLRNAAAHVQQTHDADLDVADCTFLPFTAASMRAMINEAADALEAARADAARLDSGRITLCPRPDEWGCDITMFTGVNLRAAIDEAMAGAARGEGGRDE